MSLFKNLFGKKKEEEPHYDVTNMKIHDLDVGFIFDYELESWVVEEIYEYDWGDNHFTREFKISNSKGVFYLEIEEDGELLITVTEKLSLASLGDDIFNDLMDGKQPLNKITYEGVDYYLDEEASGYFHDINNKPDVWDEFISWSYEDRREELVLTIEQWDEKKFEVFQGKYIEEHEISNIVPAAD
ncbi:DUF4178 domain-containing protein [Reichenbachiella versicolor]|uniref:DUF4178 domain-containing protein n=1 Tax=Reichenbachiella versicolor TaxID=1821036 RepID=UPI000D6DF6EE|nr:DUF4178 domain-containing protein [Reichenbachiella versicolor]